MIIFDRMKKLKLFRVLIVLSAVFGMLLTYKLFYSVNTVFNNDEYYEIIDKTFKARNQAILKEDSKAIKVLYDTSKKYGNWAYEHEVKKMKYLKKWSDKQGIKFFGINSNVVVRQVKKRDSGFRCNLIVATEYQYVYDDEPNKVNSLRIGAYHSVDMVEMNGTWYITREWYTDPFADSLNLDEIKTEEIKNYITTQQGRDNIIQNERRASAVQYADKYCGAAGDEKNGYKYNKKYRDYNPQGGDCANFASQILFEGGKVRKTRAWNYTKSEGSRAWVNAQGFKDYMVNSGRASVAAYGSYNKVYKASYKLQPGDFVAYEKNGKVTHISVVTGYDSKGYILVNCHNTDRYRVPWDLGWSDKGIKFWLVHVHF